VQLLAERMPRRFAEQWAQAHGATRALAELPDRLLDELAEALGAWKVQPSGTLGYNKAEVTLGGVDTRGLSSQTMAS
jgi:predicted flavoprotein YhiN